MKSLVLFSLVMVFFPGSARAQQEERPEVWQRLEYFVGSWKGHETGRAGMGQGERTYRFVLGGKFLFSQNTSRFEPQEKNPEGEVHEDWVLFSYDSKNRRVMAREFFIETYVIRYALDPVASSRDRLVFLSQEIENGPQLRARLTYQIKNNNEFEEIFEVASGEKDFEVFIRNFWTRAE